MSPESRPLVVFHSNCADGFSAAWCFWRMLGKNADYHPGVYGKPPPDVKGRIVFIVDFSYPRAVIEQISWDAKRMVIIDHHRTAEADLAWLPQFKAGDARSYEDALMVCRTSNVPECVVAFDMERSGCTMAWDFLFPDEPRPLLLGHVEDHDLWRFKLPHTREIQANVFSYEYKFEEWNRLMKADQAELLKMTVAGAAIERKHHKDIAELVKVCQRMMVIDDWRVPVASLPYTLVSDAAILMAKGQPFAACYWDTADGRIFGLRSDDDGEDVSAIAKLYGGGGHMHAAGFTVPRDHELAMS